MSEGSQKRKPNDHLDTRTSLQLSCHVKNAQISVRLHSSFHRKVSRVCGGYQGTYNRLSALGSPTCGLNAPTNSTQEGPGLPGLGCASGGRCPDTTARSLSPDALPGPWARRRGWGGKEAVQPESCDCGPAFRTRKRGIVRSHSTSTDDEFSYVRVLSLPSER